MSIFPGDRAVADSRDAWRVRPAGRLLPALWIFLSCSAALPFEQASAELTQQAYAKASNSAPNDYFGEVVAISGDTMVVGARLEDSAATGINGDQLDDTASGAGAAYVFVRNAGVWTQQAYLKGSNTEANDVFGVSVAIDGDTIVVGADGEASNATGVNGDETDNSGFKSGAAYVFVREGNTWTQQAYLKASNTEDNDIFGNTVAISGDTIVVGAWGERSNATGVNGNQQDNSVQAAGAAYVFTRSGNTWSQQAYLKASNTGFQDTFSYSLDISGDTIVVGARNEASNSTGVNGNEASNSKPGTGAAYIFVRNGSTWSQQAYLKPSNSPVSFNFGWSVAVSGDTVAVGAIDEASNATGVGGNQDDFSAPGAGAVYVFARSGMTWSQQAYVKASNTQESDRFGQSVALDGNNLIVGAEREASNATGIDGDESNNNASTSGAVYVFVRSGSTWSQAHYVKASNTGFLDFFGGAVAISGETFVVGAWGEAGNTTGVGGDQSNNSYSAAGAAYVFIGLAGAPPFTINAGVNDAWVSEGAPFQGFFFTAYPTLKVFFLAWFTFDSVPPDSNIEAIFGAADSRWVTASGAFTGDTVNLQVELTTGGVFNSSNPLATQSPNYGTITVAFVNCGEAIVTYNFPGLGLSGQFTVTRVVPSNEALCMALSNP